MNQPIVHAGYETIIVSRRLALFRNLSSAVFPERASPDEAKTVHDKVRTAFAELVRASGSGVEITETAHNDAGWVERMAVYERLCDGDPDETKREHVVFLEAPGFPDVVVNTSDHVEISVNCEQLPFADALARALKTADTLGKRLNFAGAEPFGWLAADPGHAGVGMYISQSFCFGALMILRELDSVLRGVERIGFDIMPVCGDSGADSSVPELAPGSCYRISPVPNDGMDAAALAAKAERVFAALAEIEKNARIALGADHVSRDMLEDYAMRAVGVGAGARSVSENEYLDLFAALAFAVDMGVFKEVREQGECKPLFAFFTDSVTLFALQKVMTGNADFDEDHADFLRKRFLADFTRRDFSRFVPELYERINDDMPEWMTGQPAKKRRKKK